MPRIALAFLGLVLLSGCNILVTEQPLFTAADEAGAPALKPGVWLIFQEDGCKFDETRPIDEWPDCAGGGVIRPGEVIDHDQKAPKGVFEHSPFVFAAGAPRIAEMQMKEQVTSGDGGAQTTFTYAYGAARTTKLDDQGRIVAVTYWFVLCGPPAPKDKHGDDTALGTLKPFPGLKMKPGDATCTTDSKAVVRSAAVASEAYKKGPLNAKWLRDGDK